MRYLVLCLVVLLLGSCGAPSGIGSPPIAPPATPTASLSAATPGNNTAAAATAVTVTPTPISAPVTPTAAVAPVTASTIAPATIIPSSVPATAAASTPAAVAGTLTTIELKYRLIEQYGIFYCPTGGSPPTANDETDLALAGFALIQSDAEVFRAILAHDQLSASAGFTTQQKLLIYRDYRKLSLVTLAHAGDAYSFSLRTMERLQGVLLTGSITPLGVSTISGRQPTVNRCTA